MERTLQGGRQRGAGRCQSGDWPRRGVRSRSAV